MPGPYLRNPVPYWLRPENASVLDSPLTKAARTIASLTGINDPQSQVLALLNPMVPEAGASVQALEGLGAKAIKAYHGSTHDFEQFSVSKIGTGEGSQAYGHGLYFAENPSTAASYKKAGVADPRDAVGNAIKAAYHISGADNLTTAVMRDWMVREGVPSSHMTPEIVDAALEAARGQRPDGSVTESAIRAYKRLDSLHGPLPTGKTYEVAIHADPEHLLDWDKPLSEQSPQVQTAVQRMRDAGVLGDEFGAITPTTTGEQLMRNSGVLAPEHNLNRFGVPGIKYLDQGSRAAGEGTRNFVIFDDSLVSVLKKYGVALPVIEGMRQKAQANGGRVATTDVNGAINQ